MIFRLAQPVTLFLRSQPPRFLNSRQSIVETPLRRKEFRLEIMENRVIPVGLRKYGQGFLSKFGRRAYLAELDCGSLKGD